MAAYVTEQWPERSYQRGVSARRAWLVTGVSGEEEARTAPGIAAPGSGFLLDARLIAAEPIITPMGSPLNFKVSVEFSSPSGGGGNGGNLEIPPEYQPQISTETIELDKDIDGNPIINSARDAFDKPVQVRRASIRYVYKRWESAFDGPRALLYSGRAVNSDTVDLPGFGSVAAGQAYCESITVASAFNSATTPVQVIYVFELRQDGFKTRILDQGMRATYGTVAHELFDSKGNRISFPVRLNGRGGTYEDLYYVDSTQTDLPTSLTEPPAGAEIEDTGDAVFLKYRVYTPLPFSGLTLTA